MECERNRHEDRRPSWFVRFGTSIRWIVSLHETDGIESGALRQRARESGVKVFETPHNTLITKK
jgi:hypothetical protein